MRRIFVFFILGIIAWSCSNDDNSSAPAPEPPRPLGEVAIEEENQIQEYLRTHFYNYEEFDSVPENFDSKIRIDSIEGENSDKIPLVDQMQSEEITVASSDLGIPESGSVPLKYYYLVVQEGDGGSPTVADSTYFKYEGTKLDNSLFDSSNSYNWRYLPNFLRGFSLGLSQLNAGGAILVEDNGTTSIENPGIGLVIFPSGLGYYNSPPSGSVIGTYEPLLFKLELGLFVENTDFDNDGVPSIMEDVNGDGNVNNDNTDEDFFSSGQPATNHLDSDDDNDGILTRDEITLDENGNLIMPLPDADGDGVPDYLDADDTP